ncbi:MAG TPA: hypothetical protein VGD81_02065, partial [Opitutaceae bacterium]
MRLVNRSAGEVPHQALSYGGAPAKREPRRLESPPMEQARITKDEFSLPKGAGGAAGTERHAVTAHSVEKVRFARPPGRAGGRRYLFFTLLPRERRA